MQQQEFTSLQFVKNHKGAKDFPSEIQKYLNKELQNGTILGPFDHNPFICNVCISPLNSVPKMIQKNVVLLACCQGSKPVLESFSDIQCVFLEDSRRHCIFL